jgi:hypothetical protein
MEEVATVTRTFILTVVVGSLVPCVPGLAFAQASSSPPPLSPASETATTPASPAPVAPAPPSSPPPAPPPAWQYPPAPPPPPAPAPSGSPIEVMSLRLMREKGIISQAEYDSAVRDLSETAGLRAAKEGSVVIGKWATTIYGFAEADAILDSTRSFADAAGSAPVSRAGSVAGENWRYQMGIRNSRIGVRLKAPETSGGVRATAQFEWDWLGMPAVVGATTAAYSIGGVSEGTFMSNPIVRIRHLNVKVETPIVDFLFGQYWAPFGWQPLYNPNTVEIQGVPGELFFRTPQFKISKTVKAHPITFEIQVAATRPVQRDTGIPDGVGGIRLALDSWTGVQTIGAGGTQISPLSLAASGLVRRVEVNTFSAAPKTTTERVVSALAIDGFIPVLPGTKDQKGNSLSLNGEFATGYGFADQYTGLTGGVAFFPYPAPPMGGTQAIPNIDNGIVAYSNDGVLHGIQWTTYNMGAQYYLPGLDGKLFLSGNYSHIESANIGHYGTTAAALTKAEDWFDVNMFADPVPAVRLGLEYANFNTMTADGIHSINHRVQFSGFFIF